MAVTTDNTGDTTYWLDGQPFPCVVNTTLTASVGDTTFWFDGEPMSGVFPLSSAVNQSSFFFFMGGF